MENEAANDIVDPSDDQHSIIFKKKEVPSDNQCLFSSIGFIITGSIDDDCGAYFRGIVVSELRAKPHTYNEAFLGCPNEEYCKWISVPKTWGGAIEISILADFFGLEIVVVNGVNGILNRFGEDKNHRFRAFIYFNGIHYEPLYIEHGENIITVFCSTDLRMLEKAAEMAKEKQSNDPDKSKSDLQCEKCDISVIDEMVGKTCIVEKQSNDPDKSKSDSQCEKSDISIIDEKDGKTCTVEEQATHSLECSYKK